MMLTKAALMKVAKPWILPAALAVAAGVQTYRLGNAQTTIEELRHEATKLEALHLEASLKLEREFNRKLMAQERATERLVTQWRRDLEQETDEATDVKTCGPADLLSPRTRERLRNLSPEAGAGPDPGGLP